MGCQSNRPLFVGGLTSVIKQKSHIWLFQAASVVMVKQQDGDKKNFKKQQLCSQGLAGLNVRDAKSKQLWY
jgi:hypothetical protein